jgi:hypothetical protein
MDDKNQQQNNPSTINQDWFMRHKWFFASITFVIIGAGVIFHLQVEYRRKNFKIDLPVHIENTTTKDWQTYFNDQYGFEIMYPPSFKAEKAGVYLISIVDKKYSDAQTEYPGLWLSVEQNPEKLTLMEWWTKYYNKENFSEPVPATIVGSNGIRTIEREGFGSTEILFQKDDHIFKFLIIGLDESDLILSTFKFVESGLKGWNTYRNTRRGYGLQFPANWTRPNKEIQWSSPGMDKPNYVGCKSLDYCIIDTFFEPAGVGASILPYCGDDVKMLLQYKDRCEQLDTPNVKGYFDWGGQGAISANIIIDYLESDGKVGKIRFSFDNIDVADRDEIRKIFSTFRFITSLSATPPSLNSIGSESKKIVLHSKSEIDVNWKAVSDTSWISIQKPDNGIISPNNELSIPIHMNTSGLEPDTYYANLIVQGNFPTLYVPITVVVN